LKKFGIIYKITCIPNGKVYIGQTNSNFKRRYDCGGKGIERVCNCYLSNIRNNRHYNKHLYNSILKYGFDSFKVDEEFDIAYSYDELNFKEIYWIDFYKSYKPKYGFNSEKGGNKNKIITEETRMKQSISQKKRFEDPNEKLKARQRVVSEETRIKLSIANKGKIAHPMSEENKLALNEAKKRSVMCITTGEVFEYMLDALKRYEIKSHGNLTMACNGKRNYCGTFNGQKLQWKYIDYEREVIKCTTH